MSSKKITLRAWIEQEGVHTLASALKVTPGTIYHWRRGYVLPNATQIRKIMSLSKGAVDLDETFAEHLSVKNKKNRFVK